MAMEASARAPWRKSAYIPLILIVMANVMMIVFIIHEWNRIDHDARWLPLSMEGFALVIFALIAGLTFSVRKHHKQ